MTNTETNTTPKPNPAHELIKTIADDMHNTMTHTIPGQELESLRDQARLLHYLNLQMIKESLPAGRPGDRHDMPRVSLALRAQNQFCRTAMAIQYLEDKKEAKLDLSNELKDSDLW